MKHCQTCRWWGGGDKSTLKRATERVCGSPKIQHIDSLYGKEREQANDALGEDGAELCDASGYHACIITRAKFGCVQHEDRAHEEDDE